MPITLDERHTQEGTRTAAPPLEEKLRTEELRREKEALPELIRGSTIQGYIAGGSAIAAILGMAGLLSEVLLAIATIGIGTTLLFEGWVMASRYTHLLREVNRTRFEELAFEFGSGMTTGFIAILTAVAAIVFGSGLILSSGLAARLNDLHLARVGESVEYRQWAHELLAAAMGVQVFVGLGAATLGVLALIGPYAVTLSLVAMLAIGFASVLSNTAFCARLMGYLKQ
jgi:hypothetical protein